jgi:hypothetical protein
MGKKFIEHDFPLLIEVLAKVARSLEGINESLQVLASRDRTGEKREEDE